ncbi:hypothetical protein E1A91_D11G331200v1 [Gossypium mustelinum]|uniref:ADP-ribosyl cyclase/cyclic ADP-ribose hydrolase n=1 Tax=Gossypium mustelinum TaxID=34275 RepID=A0A5D2T1I3_GOSMU|nr:hypothetical protein E1A91_D11G331200v1 [Gossypium mustelinum]
MSMVPHAFAVDVSVVDFKNNSFTQNPKIFDQIRRNTNMLPSTPSSSAAADTNKERTCDVFLSFRGEDTRCSFVSHLYKDLCRKNIATFIDSEKLQRGDEISESLLTAIQGSRISVIVFSKGYASSRWCLDEVVKIMNCKKLKGHYFVVPVFYGVDPSDVRKQRGSFADAFAKHEENFKHDVEKVKSWRTALTSAADLSGWDSQVTRPDSTLVDKIVKDILKKLDCRSSSANLKGLVGIERRTQQLVSLFQVGDFLKLGIWGMQGIGKTKLAEAIFYHVLNGFQNHSFLANVREHEESRNLSQLRKKFLSDILEDENLDISTPTIIPSFVKDMLSRKKVLVVYDDVSELSQFEFLFGGIDRFGRGSLVIVTTRNKQVLFQCGMNLIYEAKKLNKYESIQLFCQHAFKSNHPIKYQLGLSRMVLSFANGNPLAIKFFGSSLYGKNKNYQESAVKDLKQIPNPDILKLLRSSFDGLNPVEKDIFLDIACFFKGEDRDFVTRIMEACYPSAYSRIENLIDKSLIYISQNKIEMHDIWQHVGRSIVHYESPSKPETRSRLWIPEEIYDVLTKNNGTETITGIVLDMSKLAKLELEPVAFMKMRKLRILKFYHSCGRTLLLKGLLSLPDDLRYLCWEGYPLKTLPSTFHPRYLVELDMSCSHVEQLWEGKQDLVDLKVINLKNSKNLVRIPDLSSATNLEKINFCGCFNLRELPSSLQHLEKLTLLDFSYCRSIRSLPSFYKATSLTKLHLSGCSNLFSFPEVSSNVTELWLGGTAIEEVPSSIECLSNLRLLDLRGCRRLKSLPTGIHKLKSLEKFNLGDCSRLETFPEILDIMKRLRDLDLSGTVLKELPSSIHNLIGLKYLRLNNCENLVCLPDSLYTLKSLLHLSLCGSSNLVVENLFTAIGDRPVKQKHLPWLSSLKKLDLSESNLENLPTTIKQFPLLEELILRKCKRLKSLPELPPSLVYLDAHDCTSLEDVSSIKKLFEQELFCEDGSNRFLQLKFSNCFKLGEKCVGNDIDAYDSTSVEEVSSIKNLLKQVVFCKSLGWLFTNCFQLDQKAVRSPETPKLEMPFEHMVTALTDHLQAPPRRKNRIKKASLGRIIVTCVPGSEIPEWFDFKSLGSSINIQLPSEWWSNNSWINFPCFVASVAVSFPDSYNADCQITCSSYMMVSMLGSLLEVRHQTIVFTMWLPFISTLMSGIRLNARHVVGVNRSKRLST